MLTWLSVPSGSSTVAAVAVLIPVVILLVVTSVEHMRRTQAEG